MKKLFAAAVLAGSLLLANCSTFSGANTALSAAEAFVINGVNSLCQYQVSADTVLAVLGQTSAEAAIGLICNAVKPATQSARFGGSAPVIHINGHNIIVHGHF